MKETGWKKTAGNGSDGKRTEGKKSFGRGEKTTGFSKNSAKVGVNGEKQGKAARKVSGVEDKWGTHGDRKRNVGEKDGQKRFVVDSVEKQNVRFTVSAVAVSISI